MQSLAGGGRGGGQKGGAPQIVGGGGRCGSRPELGNSQWLQGNLQQCDWGRDEVAGPVKGGDKQN